MHNSRSDIFFMITGYFLIYKESASRIKKNITKVAKLYLFSTSVYLILNLLAIGGYNQATESIVLIDLIFDIFFVGTRCSLHLWYLLTLLYGLVFIYIVTRLKKMIYLYFLAFIGLIINILLEYHTFTEWQMPPLRSLFLIRNIFCICLPYMIIGAMIHRFEHFLTTKIVVIVALISGAILLFGLSPVHSIEKIATTALGIGVFCFFKDVNVNNNLTQKLAWIGKNCTLDIYIWHLVADSLLSLIFTTIIGGIPLSIMTFAVFLTIAVLSIVIRLFFRSPITEMFNNSRPL